MSYAIIVTDRDDRSKIVHYKLHIRPDDIIESYKYMVDEYGEHNVDVLEPLPCSIQGLVMIDMNPLSIDNPNARYSSKEDRDRIHRNLHTVERKYREGTLEDDGDKEPS